MFEFEIDRNWVWEFWFKLFEVLNYFKFEHIQTIKFRYQTIRFMSNFGPNSVENLLKQFTTMGLHIEKFCLSLVTQNIGHNVQKSSHATFNV